MELVYDSLYRFSAYAEAIDLTFHQYLLLADEPVLIHTGNHMQAKALIPKLREVLGERALAYVFVSHFESDECGGLTEIITAFPDVKVLCSDVTGKQFAGFGIPINALPQKGGGTLETKGCSFAFITYPSEMHLWDGLLLWEKNRKIFFSSDLMLRHGRVEGSAIPADWAEEIEGISAAQVPDHAKRESLKQTLKALPVNFVATGHGPCLNVKEN